MLYKKIEDPATLKDSDNRNAEVFIQKAKLDYTMMMVDVEFPTEPKEANGELEDGA